MVKIMAVGAILENRSQFGWNDNGICLLGAFVQPGGTVSFNLPLEGGTEYAFVGAGDDTVNDLDLEILSKGLAEQKDTDADSTPFVGFRPAVSRNYTLRPTMYKAPSGAFSAVAILRRGGFRVPIANLAKAYDTNMAMNVAADRLGSARYHDHDNQWAIFGQVLRAGENLGISNMTFEQRKHYILVSGDANARDLDLTVSRDERVIARDDADDAKPVAGFLAGGGGYSFSVKNVDSGGPALVIASVIDQ